MTTKQTDYRNAADTSASLGQKLIQETEKYQASIADFKQHAQSLMAERESLEENKGSLIKLRQDYDKAIEDEKKVIPEIPIGDPADVAKSLMAKKPEKASV